MLKKCRICNRKFLSNLSLGLHPCADTFLKSKKKAKKLKKFPLLVGYCKCSHLTSLYPISGYTRYEKYDYSYTSDNSIVSRSHFKDIAISISKKFKINEKNFIVEAGSNDGTFLKEIYKASKAKVLGVDPSKNISNLSKEKKIETINDYFTSQSAKKIYKKFGSADLIYGANVFNHVEDISDFLLGAKKLLNKKGNIILEVPDLNSLIKKIGFDTIYHEHRHYFSEKSIFKILRKNGFYVYRIEKINYMSGSLRVYASFHKINYKINTLRKISLLEFNIFKKKVFIIIKKLQEFVHKHDKVIGIGAATKGNTLLNCCKFTDKDLIFIADKSKHKINKFTPGSAIKIVREKNSLNADAALILPWNITKFLVKKKFFKKFRYTSIPKITKNLT
jgi:2-polyprenyl-3-methyl-5-hydroxy-6-metoxy-1,4-benzoquinol methylase